MIWAVPLAAAGSAALAWLALLYGRRRGLLDQPGARRSHSLPTPRGGGIGIVVTLIISAMALALAESPLFYAWVAFALGLAAVAAIGWWDDHQPQPVLRRLTVHAAAAVLLVVTLWPGHGLLWWVLGAFALVCAINFTNFMDGINGLAATQAALVALLLMVAFIGGGQSAAALLAAVLGAACLGFLPFNLPRARVFMGDVGSGALGYAIGALLLFAWSSASLSVAAVLLLPSAFVLDAGLTLAQRMLRGRRWYAAHREHLYQWLVRSGRSHLEVSLMYLAWTALAGGLAIAAPGELQPALAMAVYAVGAGLWWSLRRRVLWQRRQAG